MKKTSLILLTATAASALILLPLLGCAKKDGNSNSSGARKVIVAYNPDAPWVYQDQNGNADGYEIAIFKEIDKLLPEYEFSYEQTAHEDMLIGVETDRYVAGLNGLFYNKTRAEKFLFSQNPTGANVAGIIIRTEDADRIKSFQDFGRSGKKLCPVPPTWGTWGIFTDYNEENPDAKIELLPADNSDQGGALSWILEGRYDAYGQNWSYYDVMVQNDDGVYHPYADRLSFVPYKGVKTWAIFNKGETELAAAYDKAWQQLVDNGTVKALSEKYLNLDTYAYVKD